MNLKKPLILASRSPRRLRLLRQIGIDPAVLPADVNEDLDPGLPPAENAALLAVRKAQEAAQHVPTGYVLGADTIVSIDGAMLGKPVDHGDAVLMLTLLSGRTHVVHTGFAIVDCPGGATFQGVEATRVTFAPLSRGEIEAYVDGGSPMDKAGAYGIQEDYGAVFVRSVEGCYYNVVGLPLAALYRALRDLQYLV